MFLLAYAARAKPPGDIDEWVITVRSIPALMAAALDVRRIAEGLVELGLVQQLDGVMQMHPQLRDVGPAATETELRRIARILLVALRPPWLVAAIVGSEYRPEMVPVDAAQDLSWLGDDTALVVLDAGRAFRQEDDAFRAWLGDVGEAVVLALEARVGVEVRHVARISPSFGYDIEVVMGTRRRRIEVKTSIFGGKDRIFLSRNEARVARRYPDEWRLVHVVLSPEVLSSDAVTPECLVSIRELSAHAVVCELPFDRENAIWKPSAEIAASRLTWEDYCGTQQLSASWIKLGYKHHTATDG